MKKLFAIIHSRDQLPFFTEAENAEEAIETHNSDDWRVRIYEVGVKIFDNKYHKNNNTICEKCGHMKGGEQ